MRNIYLFAMTAALVGSISACASAPAATPAAAPPPAAPAATATAFPSAMAAPSIAAEENWRFSAYEDTFASWGQYQIYHGALHPFEHLLLRTPLVPWSFAASNIYHNWYWFPFVGQSRAKAALRTNWGKLLREQYSPDRPINPGYGSRKPLLAAASGAAAFLLALGIGLWGMRRKSQ